MVLGSEATENISLDIMMEHVKHLVKERDEFLQNWASSSTSENTSKADAKKRQSTNVSSDTHHLAVELADWKSKLRKQRQEL